MGCICVHTHTERQIYTYSFENVEGRFIIGLNPMYYPQELISLKKPFDLRVEQLDKWMIEKQECML